MKNLFFAIVLLWSSLSFGAGTTSVTKTFLNYAKGAASPKYVQLVTIGFIGDASTGSIPDTNLDLSGYLIKAVTKPGSPAPTANYDISLTDPISTTLDSLATALNNRHTTNVEQVYPMIAGTVGTVTARSPFLSPGTYVLSIANNSQASAVGTIYLYLVDQP